MSSNIFDLHLHPGWLSDQQPLLFKVPANEGFIFIGLPDTMVVHLLN